MYNDQEIIELYLNGDTLLNIARLCGYKTKDPIKLILRKNGVKIRTNQEAQLNRCLKNPASFKGAPVGTLNKNWRGGRLINSHGYTEIYTPDNLYGLRRYVLEHRLVMEKSLGRPLTKNEVVHHIDGNIQNNSIENLQLMSKGEHRSLHLRETSRDVSGRFMATTSSNTSLESGNIGERPEMENTEGSLSDPVTTKCPDSLVDEDIV